MKKMLLAILTVIIYMIVAPFIVFWLGYFSGYFAELMIGKYIVEFFALFNLDVPIDKIPLISGVLTWIGGAFFKPSNFKFND